MGYKILCLKCRKAFSRGTDLTRYANGTCPDCGGIAIQMPHRFRPPAKTEDQKWKVIQFLIENGFHYQHVYEQITQSNGKKILSELAIYPETMREAKAFVEKYKEQAFKK